MPSCQIVTVISVSISPVYVVTSYHIRKLINWKGLIFFLSETWSINYRWHRDIKVFAGVDTSYFRLSGDRMFLRIIYHQHHQRFARKLAVSRSGDIKNVCPGGKGLGCTLSPLAPIMDEGND